MKRTNILLLLVFLLVTFTSRANIDTTRKILFIGNSLTYTNDLPALVKQAAAKKGITVTTEMIAFPNYALEDHWNDGHIQQLIAKNKYDFVVVQQGPSSQAEGRTMLMDYGKKIKELCDKHGSTLAFFMVWPARANLHMIDGVIKNYSDAAVTTQSILCPVGAAWKKYFADTGEYDLYGPDQFHPAEKGSRMAAEVIVDSFLAVPQKN
jgi:hypothetical protein